MIISLPVDQVLKMIPKPIDRILPTVTATTVCAFKTTNFKSAAWSCGQSRRSIIHKEWYQLWGHYEEYRAQSAISQAGDPISNMFLANDEVFRLIYHNINRESCYFILKSIA